MLIMQTLGTMLLKGISYRPANTHNPPQAKIPVYAFQSSYHEFSAECLPKYPFAGELFGDAIIGAEAFRVLPSVSASLALVQHTYQRYYEEVQNSINRSRNHQDIVARNAMRADILVPKPMDWLTS